ncbi:MAG: hypothetical protein DWQ07_24865 [Chloroflexi bacterium]|nr:MAG: hypothetical protein DWQ07_24865 [Chloroflexota bacterium]MBL1197075.1 hypothetical protein [Chloroflexota bacterium]
MVLLQACGPEPTPPATPDRAATVEVQYMQQTQAVIDAQVTLEANATEAAVERATSFAILAATQTEQQFIVNETATAEATARAEPMLELIQELYDDDYIQSTEGSYHQLDDFDESWAMLNYFDIWRTGFAPSDFIIRADVAWDSASDSANWFNSGCGFLYRLDRPENSFYLVFLTLDGYVNMQYWSPRAIRSLGFSYYGQLDLPSGNAEMVLVAQGSEMHVLINGKLVHTRIDTNVDKGELAYTLLSGTNAGFGTRCVFENVGLWELESD